MRIAETRGRPVAANLPPVRINRWADARPAGGGPASLGSVGGAAMLLLTALSVTWGWWAWKEGAYFGVVMLPGTILLCMTAVLLSRVAPWGGRLRLSPGARVALISLTALGLWTGLSALWSAAPDVAVVDGLRVLTYALVFGLGIWLCNLLAPRIHLALAPVVIGAGFAAVITIIALFGSTPRDLFETDGTLDFPLGYRNANVAFFAIASFAAISMAASTELDFRARGAALAVASVSLSLFALGQSRASAPAIVLALLAFVLLSPQRLRALSWLALAILPMLAVVPSLLDVYAAVNDEGLAAAVSEMNAVGWTLALIAIGAAALGAVVARFEARLPGLGNRSADTNRAVAGGIGALVVASLIAFVVAVGNPVDWVGDRVQEFKETRTPDLSEEATRFSLDAGSERYDLWVVAIDEFRERPLLGTGAGAFKYAYLEKREVLARDPHDAHSVEFENLAELGLPGLVLLLATLGGATVGAMRSRELGPQASMLSAAALSAGLYWLVHASLDWFWPYPVVTAPVMMLLGAACAPAVFAGERIRGQRWRPWLAGAAVLGAIAAVPPFLSERYVNNAYAGWQGDLERAYRDLDAARFLNPLSDAPLLAEGAIARELGDRPRAIAAFRAAAEERPEEWGAHYLLAELQAKSDPPAARREARIALELNPLSSDVNELADRLGVSGAAEG